MQILSRLRDPWKFLFVDMDIAILCACIGMTLLMSGLPTLAVVALPSGLGYWIHRGRADKVRGAARHWLYWWMPPLLQPLRRIPPMYCVLTVG